MSWHRVEFLNSGAFATSAIATDFVTKVGAAFLAAGMPTEALVYHGQSTGGDHIYFLSPKASAVAKDILASFGAIACDSQPQLLGLRQVTF